MSGEYSDKGSAGNRSPNRVNHYLAQKAALHPKYFGNDRNTSTVDGNIQYSSNNPNF